MGEQEIGNTLVDKLLPMIREEMSQIDRSFLEVFKREGKVTEDFIFEKECVRIVGMLLNGLPTESFYFLENNVFIKFCALDVPYSDLKLLENPVKKFDFVREKSLENTPVIIFSEHDKKESAKKWNDEKCTVLSLEEFKKI